jgi:hypothetical protein
MTQTTTWTEGINDYKKSTLSVDSNEKKNHYHTELCDTELMGLSNIYEIYAQHLSERQSKTVEVLYSGGLDSEIILLVCKHYNIPVVALTGKQTSNGVTFNTPDLYYAEKFCRENNITQKILEFNTDHHMESGDYIDMLSPYYITDSHVALHFWLFEQATSFPVIGGDYSWPWTDVPILSPHKHSYQMYYQFLKDKGIHGIGNMMSHSLDSNLLFIKSHIEMFKTRKYGFGYWEIPQFKKAVFENLGFNIKDVRLRFYGSEFVPRRPYNELLTNMLGTTTYSVSWNKLVADILGGQPGSNDKF